MLSPPACDGWALVCLPAVTLAGKAQLSGHSGGRRDTGAQGPEMARLQYSPQSVAVSLLQITFFPPKPSEAPAAIGYDTWKKCYWDSQAREGPASRCLLRGPGSAYGERGPRKSQ